ncbi:MAG: HAMP domain-containing sensor histidine kinase [Opitutus sp.]
MAVGRLERENAQLRGDLRTIGRRLSHDLRNPLNCISTANEGLIDLSPTPDPLAECFHGSISGSVSEMAALVDRLNVFLKTTAEVAPTTMVEMGEIIAVTLDRLSPSIRATIATVAPCAEWPPVRGVSPWIALVWENLIQNSLQHARVKPLAIELGCTRGNGQHRFWIRDNGCGVTPERRARLFFPFERLHEANAPHGYGLPMVKRLIEMQQGSCGYEPCSAGACFYFTLPAT